VNLGPAFHRLQLQPPCSSCSQPPGRGRDAWSYYGGGGLTSNARPWTLDPGPCNGRWTLAQPHFANALTVHDRAVPTESIFLHVTSLSYQRCLLSGPISSKSAPEQVCRGGQCKFSAELFLSSFFKQLSSDTIHSSTTGGTKSQHEFYARVHHFQWQ
jgi:hypothetical protein